MAVFHNETVRTFLSDISALLAMRWLRTTRGSHGAAALEVGVLRRTRHEFETAPTRQIAAANIRAVRP